MLSEEEKNASGCLVIVGLVLVSFAVGMATAPWAGLALCGVALVAIAVIGIYAGKKEGRPVMEWVYIGAIAVTLLLIAVCTADWRP